MTEGLSFAALRAANATRCLRWHGPDTTPWLGVDWSNAMGGEAGEAQNVVKKLRRHETGTAGRNEPSVWALRSALALEIADTITYADLLAHYYGISTAAAVAAKFNMVSSRHGFPERLADYSKMLEDR